MNKVGINMVLDGTIKILIVFIIAIFAILFFKKKKKIYILIPIVLINIMIIISNIYDLVVFMKLYKTIWIGVAILFLVNLEFFIFSKKISENWKTLIISIIIYFLIIFIIPVSSLKTHEHIFNEDATDITEMEIIKDVDIYYNIYEFNVFKYYYE